MSILIKDFCYCFHCSRVNVWELKYWSLGMCQFKFWETARFFLKIIVGLVIHMRVSISLYPHYIWVGGCVLVFSQGIVCSSLVSNEVQHFLKCWLLNLYKCWNVLSTYHWLVCLSCLVEVLFLCNIVCQIYILLIFSPNPWRHFSSFHGIFG